MFISNHIFTGLVILLKMCWHRASCRDTRRKGKYMDMYTATSNGAFMGLRARKTNQLPTRRQTTKSKNHWKADIFTLIVSDI